MNKLYRYIIVGILALIPCFSSAANITLYDGLNDSYNSTNVFINPLYNTNTEDIYLLCITNNSSSILQIWQGAHEIRMDHGDFPPFCLGVNNTLQDLSVIVNGNQSYSAYNVSYIKASNFNSISCQTEFNLIPISSVTAQYCKLNFDLISPTECPQSSGTGAVNWTAWYINNEQYPGTASLNIFIPEFIKYSTTYNENETILDIEGYNADTDYIENVINNEKLTPSNEDFTLLLQGLVNFIPYLFIGLLILRFVKILNKVWK